MEIDRLTEADIHGPVNGFTGTSAFPVVTDVTSFNYCVESSSQHCVARVQVALF